MGKFFKSPFAELTFMIGGVVDMSLSYVSLCRMLGARSQIHEGGSERK